MKLFNIIKKNFKILLRSKASAFVVIVGPLLIIALIALALSNTQGYSIGVGIYAPDKNNLTLNLMDHLKEDGYKLMEYPAVDSCVEDIKLRKVNVCIQLPDNFVVANNKTNDIHFYVDQSRINLVESIVSSVTSTFGVQSEEIALSLTQRLIDTIDFTEEELNKQEQLLTDAQKETSTINSEASKIKTKSEKNNLQDASSEVTALKVSVTSSKTASTTLKTNIDDLLKDLDSLLDDLESEGSHAAKTSAVRSEYNKLNNATSLNTLTSSLQSLDSSISDLKSELDAANDDMKTVKTSSETIGSKVTSLKEKTSQLQASIDAIQAKINGIQITSAENIVNPFSISVDPIVSSSNRSTYMFPYFLTLIILFVGIMLSSTLLVMEKKSRAFFRTFTTPTSVLYHLFGAYITNTIILSLQVGIIIAAAWYYLKIPFLANLPVTILLLLLSVSFFIFLGMLIGYIFKTQEGTTIASISIGCLFIFLSNLILPIESFPEIVKLILGINPYMLVSELLKQSILFNVGLSGMKRELLILIGYLFVSFIFAIIFQKLSFMTFSKGFSNRKILKRPHITKDNYFRLRDGTLLKNKIDLYTALWGISEEELALYANPKNNEIALWIKEAFKERRLARKIRKAKTKEQLIKVLEKDAGFTEKNINKVLK